MSSKALEADAQNQHQLALAKRERLLAAGYQDISGIIVGPGCPKHLTETISLQRPVMISARQSGQRSTHVDDNVARDAYEAAGVLFAKLDVFVSHLLPSYATLAGLLARSKNTVDSIDRSDGTPFRCTFTRFDLRSSGHPLVVVLTAGSASKIAQNRQSPPIVNLADELAACSPSVLCAKRADRLRRAGWPQAVMWVELEHLEEMGMPVTVVDGLTGIWLNDEFSQMRHLSDGKKDQAAALALFKTTRTTMLSRMARGANTSTGDIKMVGGNVPYTLPSATPPGLTRIELISEPISGIAKRLYLDSPRYFPSIAVVRKGLPLVVDDKGKPANQVKNLRWYLKHAGKPEWGVSALGREMVRRGYSTDPIRSRRGPAGRWDTDQLYSLQVPIWDNLDFFETGSFSRTLIGETVTIVDVWPAPGKRWADPEDFERIRRWRATETARYSRQAGHTFVNLQVEYEGSTRFLTPTSGTTPADAGTVRYLLESRPARQPVIDTDADIDADPSMTGRTQDSYGWSTKTSMTSDEGELQGAKARSVVWLEHAWIADAILQAVRRAQHAPSPRVVADEADTRVEELLAATKSIESRIEAAKREMGFIEYDVEERIAGRPEHVLPQEVRSRKWKEHEELGASIPVLETELLRATLELEDQRERAVAIRRGLEVDAIADVLVSLLDPRDVTYRALWRITIHNFKVACTRQVRFGLHGRLIEFSFDLHLSDGAVTVAVPASGSRLLGALARADQMADELLGELREGKVLDPLDQSRRLNLAQFLTAKLNCVDGRGAFLKCREPVLLRLGMATLFPATGPGVKDAHVTRKSLSQELAQTLKADPEFVAVFRHPERLAKRILKTYTALKPKYKQYLHPVGPVHAKAMQIARSRHGRVSAQDLGGGRKLLELERALKRGPWKDEWENDGVNLVLKACPACGSRKRAALVLREVSGYLCLTCESDSAGVTWPLEIFERYVVNDEGIAPAHYEARGNRGNGQDASSASLASAGLSASAADAAPGRRRAPKLDDAARDELVRAYVEEKRSMRELAFRYGLNRKDVSIILHSRGVVARTGRSPRGTL